MEHLVEVGVDGPRQSPKAPTGHVLCVLQLSVGAVLPVLRVVPHFPGRLDPAVGTRHLGDRCGVCGVVFLCGVTEGIVKEERLVRSTLLGGVVRQFLTSGLILCIGPSATPVRGTWRWLHVREPCRPLGLGRGPVRPGTTRVSG